MKKEMKKEEMKKEEMKKKVYVKPVVEKHKAVSLISGSGGGGCNYYSSRAEGSIYYH